MLYTKHNEETGFTDMHGGSAAVLAQRQMDRLKQYLFSALQINIERYHQINIGVVVCA